MDFTAMVQLPSDGRKPYEYAAGRVIYESRRFIWLPRILPVVSKHHDFWDGKTARFLWLCWATLRGTDFGWETVVEG